MPRSAHPNFLPHIKRTGISEEPAFVTLTNTDQNAGVNYSTHFKKESSGKYGKNSQPEHVFVPVPVPAQSGGGVNGTAERTRDMETLTSPPVGLRGREGGR